MIKKILFIFALVFQIICASGPNALKGLKEVQVSILPNKLTDGIYSQIKNDVEIKLRLVGIKINPDAKEILCINVISDEVVSKNGISEPLIGYIGTIQVELRNPTVVFQRDEIITTDAVTWESFVHLLHGPPEGFFKQCRDTVKDCMDSFVNDYLTSKGG